MPALIVQPPFDKRLTTLAYPLTGRDGSVLQTGYMIWDKPLPGYSGRAAIRYLYNPSTVSADYNIADASAQASLNFPNPGDTAMLAIPLSQTATWSLMFDRTFDVWQSFTMGGLPVNNENGVGGEQLGVQADVLAFMQFTGMLVNYSAGTQNVTANDITKDVGIMQLVPSWAYFGNSAIAHGLMYYGYINEWSVQYTHWTQFNVPMRCVVNVNFTMLATPGTQPPQLPGAQTPGGGFLPTPTGTNPGGTFPGVTNSSSALAPFTTTGVGGR